VPVTFGNKLAPVKSNHRSRGTSRRWRECS